MSHVAVAGSGQVDGEAASSLVLERYITQLSLVDVAPKTAEMANEELNHAITGHGFNAEIVLTETTRTPSQTCGMHWMSRRKKQLKMRLESHIRLVARQAREEFDGEKSS